MPRRESKLVKHAPTLKEVMHVFEENDANRVSGDFNMPPSGTPVNQLRAHMASFMMRVKDNERKHTEDINTLAAILDTQNYKISKLEERLNEAEQIISLLQSIATNERETRETDADYLVEHEVMYDEDEFCDTSDRVVDPVGNLLRYEIEERGEV